MSERSMFDYEFGKINECYKNPQKGLFNLKGLEITVKELKNEEIKEQLNRLKSFFEGEIKIGKKEFSEILKTIKEKYESNIFLNK